MTTAALSLLAVVLVLSAAHAARGQAFGTCTQPTNPQQSYNCVNVTATPCASSITGRCPGANEIRCCLSQPVSTGGTTPSYMDGCEPSRMAWPDTKKFDELVSNYPHSGVTTQMSTELGTTRWKWIVEQKNMCAVRVSFALKWSSLPIRCSNSFWFRTTSSFNSVPIFFRVKQVMYLLSKSVPASATPTPLPSGVTLDQGGVTIPRCVRNLDKLRGFIAFTSCSFSTAFGHIDLYDGTRTSWSSDVWKRCGSQCYFWDRSGAGGTDDKSGKCEQAILFPVNGIMPSCDAPTPSPTPVPSPGPPTPAPCVPLRTPCTPGNAHGCCTSLECRFVPSSARNECAKPCSSSPSDPRCNGDDDCCVGTTCQDRTFGFLSGVCKPPCKNTPEVCSANGDCCGSLLCQARGKNSTKTCDQACIPKQSSLACAGDNDCCHGLDCDTTHKKCTDCTLTNSTTCSSSADCCVSSDECRAGPTAGAPKKCYPKCIDRLKQCFSDFDCCQARGPTECRQPPGGTGKLCMPKPCVSRDQPCTFVLSKRDVEDVEDVEETENVDPCCPTDGTVCRPDRVSPAMLKCQTPCAARMSPCNTDNECCAGDDCRALANGTKVCNAPCVASGATCATSNDCCAPQVCSGAPGARKCSAPCKPQGQPCADANECCPDPGGATTCRILNGIGASTTQKVCAGACKASVADGVCSSNADCCATFECRDDGTGSRKCLDPCNKKGTFCAADSDCCTASGHVCRDDGAGKKRCLDKCSPPGGFCSSSEQCCNGNVCRNDDSGRQRCLSPCLPSASTCTGAANECCTQQGLVCRTDDGSTTGGALTCAAACVARGVQCSPTATNGTSAACCDAVKCVRDRADGVHKCLDACKADNAGCAGDAECCYGLNCRTNGAANGTPKQCLAPCSPERSLCSDSSECCADKGHTCRDDGTGTDRCLAPCLPASASCTVEGGAGECCTSPKALDCRRDRTATQNLQCQLPCNARGTFCSSDDQCCAFDECRLDAGGKRKRCLEPCKASSGACDPNKANDCCFGRTCAQDRAQNGTFACIKPCAVRNSTCAADGECCFGDDCVVDRVSGARRCSTPCVVATAKCTKADECCVGLDCIAGSCAPPTPPPTPPPSPVAVPTPVPCTTETAACDSKVSPSTCCASLACRKGADGKEACLKPCTALAKTCTPAAGAGSTDECCPGAECRDDRSGKFACLAPCQSLAGLCAKDEECCVNTVCRADGQTNATRCLPPCANSGATCAIDNDCCAGTTCQLAADGVSRQCAAPCDIEQSKCDSTKPSTCCAGLSCRANQKGIEQCLPPCAVRNATCARDDECCKGDTCRANALGVNVCSAPCSPSGGFCTDSSHCCLPAPGADALVCREDGTAANTKRCSKPCVQANSVCQTSSDCCPTYDCIMDDVTKQRVCTSPCSPGGGACSKQSDCCGTLACVVGVCADDTPDSQNGNCKRVDNICNSSSTAAANGGCCLGTTCRNPCQAECFDERHLCTPGANECCQDLGYFCLESLEPSDSNTYCRFDASKPTPPPTPAQPAPPGGCSEERCVATTLPSPIGPTPSPGPTRPVATPPPCIARRSACVPGGTGEQACCGAEDNPQSSECLPDKPSVSDGDHICQPMGGFPEFQPTPEPTPGDDDDGVPVGAIVGGVIGGIVALALLIAAIIMIKGSSAAPVTEPLMVNDPLSSDSANNPLYESRTSSTDNVLYRPPEM